ncbi:MAG TPA: hypothetical protein VM674_03555 [Candidatus Acidoferrum sp.]|nr:hypothetical protein [Candidatus Acidoferrum sp.]
MSAIFLALTAVTLFGFVPAAPTDPRAVVARYPSVQGATTVGETFNLVSIIFSVASYLALYQALRPRSLVPAVWGTGLSLLGLGVSAVEAVPRIAFGHLSDLYRSPGLRVDDQTTVALIWQATQGMFSQFDTAATIFLTTGYVVLGMAMFWSPAFGRKFGGAAMLVGIGGLIGIYLLGINSLLFAPLGLFVLIVLPTLIGLRTYRLSFATEPG